MKRFTKFAVAILAVSFIISSCSMEKRVYRQGYAVSWKSDAKTSEKQVGVKAEKSNGNVLSEKSANAFTNEESSIKKDELSNVKESKAYAKNENSEVVENNASKTSKNVKISKQIVVNNIIAKAAVKKLEKIAKKASPSNSGVPKELLYLLCFFIPFVAVGFATNWNLTAVISNLLWTCLCGIPGIIHALIKVSQSR